MLSFHFLPDHESLDFDPLFLTFCQEDVSELLFFDFVEVIDNDTDEKVEDELGANDHETNKEENSKELAVSFGLHINAC